MAKTKKRLFQQHRSFQSRSPLKGILWLLVGLFLGVGGTLGFSLYREGTWLQWIPSHFSNPLLNAKNPSDKKPVSAAGKSTRPLKQEPRETGVELAQRFQFYQLLPGMEVQLPDRDTAAQSQVIAKAPSKPIQRQLAATGYIIQAAAYRQRTTAEKLKNRLSQQGFKTRIQAIEAEDGAWFRIILGPFADESRALQQKKRLQQHQIHGILILQRS